MLHFNFRCSWIGNLFTTQQIKLFLSLLMAAMRSKARFCGHSLAGIVGSNTAGDTDVCLL